MSGELTTVVRVDYIKEKLSESCFVSVPDVKDIFAKGFALGIIFGLQEKAFSEYSISADNDVLAIRLVLKDTSNLSQEGVNGIINQLIELYGITGLDKK